MSPLPPQVHQPRSCSLTKSLFRWQVPPPRRCPHPPKSEPGFGRAHCHITEHSSKAHLREASPAASLLLPGYTLIRIICSHCESNMTERPGHARAMRSLPPPPPWKACQPHPAACLPFLWVFVLWAPLPAPLTQRSLLPALHHSQWLHSPSVCSTLTLPCT